MNRRLNCQLVEAKYLRRKKNPTLWTDKVRDGVGVENIDFLDARNSVHAHFLDD